MVSETTIVEKTLVILYLDGTSPTPLLFSSIMSTKNDITSRHQQIIDAFLTDGNHFTV